MKNFIEPIQGTKIAEFKLSWFQHFTYKWIYEPLEILLNFLLPFVVLSAILFKGVDFMNEPFNPLWLSRTIGIIMCIFTTWCVFSIIKDWLKNDDRKTKHLTGKTFSLFVVKEGIEINNEFIPYKVKSQSGTRTWYSDGVDSFKIDGDFLIVKTNVEDPFIKIYRTLTENQIKFKIDSKYQDCKEELLSYLNNQIDKINSPNLNEKIIKDVVAELEKLPIEWHKNFLDSHPAFESGEAFDLEY